MLKIKSFSSSDMLFFSGVGLILYWSWSWTENCLQLIDDLSKICLWIINHFTWNDRWSISRFWSWIVTTQSQTFQAKSCELWRIFFTTIKWWENIFVIDNEKRNCWSLKYFPSLDVDFHKNRKIVIFQKSDKFWGGVIFDPKFDQKWGGLHSLLEGSNTTASPGHPRGPPPQNCRTATETSWKKGPGLEQPWGDSSGRPVTLIISSNLSSLSYSGPPPKIYKVGQIWPPSIKCFVFTPAETPLYLILTPQIHPPPKNSRSAHKLCHQTPEFVKVGVSDVGFVKNWGGVKIDKKTPNLVFSRKSRIFVIFLIFLRKMISKIIFWNKKNIFIFFCDEIFFSSQNFFFGKKLLLFDWKQQIIFWVESNKFSCHQFISLHSKIILCSKLWKSFGGGQKFFRRSVWNLESIRSDFRFQTWKKIVVDQPNNNLQCSSNQLSINPTPEKNSMSLEEINTLSTWESYIWIYH